MTEKIRNGNTFDMSGAKTYRKIAPTRAIKMSEPFAVTTPGGLVHGDAGDYLCETTGGDRYPAIASVFEQENREIIAPSFRKPEKGKPARLASLKTGESKFSRVPMSKRPQLPDRSGK